MVLPMQVKHIWYLEELQSMEPVVLSNFHLWMVPMVLHSMVSPQMIKVVGRSVTLVISTVMVILIS
jgi:hypothetical protein